MATITNDLFSKLKSKFPKRQDGDGHENKVEVREDEEQSVKLQEIMDLLVAAGYFRARIKGLSSFDKVVGGMTWCIESCNVDVDVDLLFQENSTIGQKIALTEKIVAVLPKLKCPHRIEPHQIQGLDFIHIFPVIQWLVKHSLEVRSDTQESVYSYARHQFSKNFPQQLELSDKQQRMIKSIKTVNEVYKPHRIFRRKYALPNKDSDKVQITLLQYGYKDAPSSSENTNLAEHEIQQIMNNMTITEEVSFDYDDLTDKDREKLLSNYKELEISTTEEQEVKENKEEMVEKLKKLKEQNAILDKEIEKVKETIEDMKTQREETEKALRDLESENINPEKAEEIENLLVESEKLKKQEIEFKANCKKELERLDKQIEEAEKSKSESFDEKNKEMDDKLEEWNEKLKVVRLQVARKTRAISVLQRKIDDIPSRAELAQYQKRFIELYNQISAKHKETKQYYTLYNTLEDTRMYMKKELSLLNSVCDSYPEAMLSREGKEEFLQQLTNILKGVEQSKIKLDGRLSEEKKKRDGLSEKLQELVDLNRTYVAAIKQLKLECQKNEAILAKLNSNSP